MTHKERQYVRLALAYVSNIPYLMRAQDEGRLADESAIWKELQRAIETLEDALSISAKCSRNVDKA